MSRASRIGERRTVSAVVLDDTCQHFQRQTGPGAGIPSGDERHAGIDANDATQQRLVAFPQMLGKYKTLQSVAHRDYLLQTPYARSLAKDLYSQGADVLHGMLFRASFRVAARDNLVVVTQYSEQHYLFRGSAFAAQHRTGQWL
jgi:hypothetical protein